MMSRHVVCSAITALALCWTASAEAIIIRVELKPDLGEVDTPVYPDSRTRLVAPIGTVIKDFDWGDEEGYEVTVMSPRAISIRVLDDAPPTNLTVTLRDNRMVTLRMFQGANIHTAASRVECYDPGTMPTTLAAAAADLELGRWVATAKRVEEPVEIPWRADEHELKLKTGFTVYTEDAVLLSATLSSEDTRYPIREIQLRDHLGVEIDATLVYAEHELLVGKAVVDPRHALVVAFRVADPHQIAKGWTFLAVPAIRMPQAEFKYSARRRRSPLQRRVAVAVNAFGGASNLDDGAGNDETAWTSLQGVGACATHGVSRHLSMEGCLDFTRTSDVVFNDAMWEQDQGELTVDETAGRLMAAGLLHTNGQRWIPFARLALGARFSKHEIAMGSRRQSEYRSGLMAGFGGGVNVMLGKRAMARLSFGYTSSFGGSDTAEGVEIGLSLAALWDVRP